MAAKIKMAVIFDRNRKLSNYKLGKGVVNLGWSSSSTLILIHWKLIHGRQRLLKLAITFTISISYTGSCVPVYGDAAFCFFTLNIIVRHGWDSIHNYLDWTNLYTYNYQIFIEDLYLIVKKICHASQERTRSMSILFHWCFW